MANEAKGITLPNPETWSPFGLNGPEDTMRAYTDAEGRTFIMLRHDVDGIPVKEKEGKAPSGNVLVSKTSGYTSLPGAVGGARISLNVIRDKHVPKPTYGSKVK